MGVEGKERTGSELLAHASLGQSQYLLGPPCRSSGELILTWREPSPARAQIAPRACRKHHGRVRGRSRGAENLVALPAGRGYQLAGNRIW